MKTLFAITFLGVTFVMGQYPSNFSGAFDFGKIRGPLPKLWTSNGYCPPSPHQDQAVSYGLSEDMYENLILIGGTPHTSDPWAFEPSVFGKRASEFHPSLSASGPWQVRVHWLFDLVKPAASDAKGGEIVNVPPIGNLNFTLLDNLLGRMVNSNLRPGFELMGWPDNGTFFTTFDNDTQVNAWADFVAAAVSHFVSVFGKEEVGNWRFLAWNEPSCHDFDGVDISVDGYTKYYDACVEGLTRAGFPAPNFGAPDDCYPGSYSTALIQHFEGGTSFFGGPVAQPMFFGIHNKGNNDAGGIWNGEVVSTMWLQTTSSKVATEFASSYIPYVNDEADPEVGWDKVLDWRGDARYTAMQAKVIAQHLDDWVNPNNGTIPSDQLLPYGFLSFDAAFMTFSDDGYFARRTYTVRFQMNETNPRRVETIKKLPLSFMSSLSLLGSSQVDGVVQASGSGNPKSQGAIASIRSPHPSEGQYTEKEVAVLLYSSYSATSTQGNISYFFDLHHLPFASTDNVRIAQYTVADTSTNPLQQWQAAGSPNYPSNALLQSMRSHSEPIPDSISIFAFNTSLHIQGSIPLTSTRLFHLCAEPNQAPPAPAALRVHQQPNATYQRYLSWTDSTARCIARYEVQGSADNSTWFTTKTPPTIAIATMHDATLETTTPSFYRVRAIDYWNRAGAFSPVAQV